MKFSALYAVALVSYTTSAFYICPAYPSRHVDGPTIEFALSLQGLLLSYYESVPVNATFFSTLPPNGDPPTDWLDNVIGLQQQALLDYQALEALAASAHVEVPKCSYTLPAAPATAQQHLVNIDTIEATLCGAFIALSDYVQSPQAAFLMTRVAVEHGTHASYIGTHLKSQVYFANSTSLVPVFLPSEVLTAGTGVGTLGQYLNNCVPAPVAPCGGTVVVGSAGAQLENQRF
jgi:cerevisin